MSKKAKKPQAGAVSEIPGEGADVAAGAVPDPIDDFDTSDEESEAVEGGDDSPPDTDLGAALAAEQARLDDEPTSEEGAAAGTGPVVGDRVRYSEIRDGMLLDLIGRVLYADGALLTLDLPATTGSPARVVAASRYSQATRTGWWV